MKSLHILFILLTMLIMPLVIAADSQTPHKESQFFTSVKNHSATKIPESEASAASLRGGFDGRHYKYGQGIMTCDKYPRVCRVKGSPGPDCCSKKCVNVSTDRNNCGWCGNRCRYSQICCRGKCVNPLFDKNHCGRCGNKCKKGDSCAYGMCNYA